MQNPSLLFVDADRQARAQTIQGFVKVFGPAYRVFEAATTCEADTFLFDYIVSHGQLPLMVVTELYVPCSLGQLNLYPVQLHALYPELPMVLVTSLADTEKLTPYRRNLRLLSVLAKPWSKDNFRLLSQTLATTL